MEYQINNTAELLSFIKRDEVTATQGTEIVCKALNIFHCGNEMLKSELIEATNNYISKYCKNDNLERPLFFEINLDII